LDTWTLKNKVAVVTGGASGIGLAIATHLARAGAHLVIADVEADSASAAATQIASTGVRAIAVACDVSSRESVENLAQQSWEQFGHVELIVNNAGVIGPMGPLIDCREEDFKWITEVNYFGVWHGCTIFGKRFVRQGTRAHIIITGSEHSLGAAHPMAGAYTASKHAVLGIAEVLRMELPEFIRVQMLCPGLVNSNISTATRNRPERFGGPVTSQRKLDLGMSAEDIGERTVRGIERGDFYIVTHSHDIELVERRYQEQRTAFEQQAPRYAGDDRYDVRKLMAQNFGRQRKDG
jgi:NAD(P)-dependent dehydrogenase (short-subunit alcohol dehydrogenase family)